MILQTCSHLYLFLAYGVMTPGVVVCSVLLSRHQLLRVEEGAVDASARLVDNAWLEVDKDSAWNVLAIAWIRL